ncbi:MAG: class I SAM-dependent methyltransferase [Acidimicrobiia bacterium]
MPVHEVAASGFDQGAEVYEQARPSYPPDAVAWLAEHLRIGAGARVVDVAAGTGKLTRLLTPFGAELVGAEPVPGMRSGFVTMCPGVPLVASTAELLPIAAASLDAITVAQAFHWFDAPAALTEFARVLRPGGRLGLVWNARDRSDDLVDQLWAIMDRIEKRAPWRNHDEWRDSALVEHPDFTGLTEATFHHEQWLTEEQVIARFRSVSHIAVLPPVEQERAIDEIRRVLQTHPVAVEHELVAIPYRVDAYWCERR